MDATRRGLLTTAATAVATVATRNLAHKAIGKSGDSTVRGPFVCRINREIDVCAGSGSPITWRHAQVHFASLRVVQPYEFA